MLKFYLKTIPSTLNHQHGKTKGKNSIPHFHMDELGFILIPITITKLKRQSFNVGIVLCERTLPFSPENGFYWTKV